MVIKWVLVVFALAALGLVVVTKVISFMNPPRPGPPGESRPPALRRAERALRWPVLLPVLIGLALLALTLWG